MDGVCDSVRATLTGDVVRSWRAIENGTTPATENGRQKYWKHWTQYVRCWNRGPFLDNETQLESNIIIQAYAARVRTGFYGEGNTVKVQTVTKALAAISKTLELAGQPSPVYREDQKYQVSIEKMIEGMRRADPLPRPQLAVPVKLVRESSLIALNNGDTRLVAITDLMVIAFYYLLRSGEYTKPKYVTSNKKRRKASRTVQFRVKDVGFFQGSAPIDKSTASFDDLLNATSATLRIENQKNGKMGQCIHHEAIKDVTVGPTQALARRVHHILSNGGDGNSLICEFKPNSGDWDCIQSNDIVLHVRVMARILGIDKEGLDIDLIGAHSLRAGGAMALKLMGVADTIIMKMGRWSGLTFLMYIHNQIAHLSCDLSQKLSTDMPFVNITNFGE